MVKEGKKTQNNGKRHFKTEIQKLKHWNFHLERSGRNQVTRRRIVTELQLEVSLALPLDLAFLDVPKSNKAIELEVASYYRVKNVDRFIQEFYQVMQLQESRPPHEETT